MTPLNPGASLSQFPPNHHFSPNLPQPRFCEVAVTVNRVTEAVEVRPGETVVIVRTSVPGRFALIVTRTPPLALESHARHQSDVRAAASQTTTSLRHL